MYPFVEDFFFFFLNLLSHVRAIIINVIFIFGKYTA